MQEIDTDKDGFLTLAEFEAHHKEDLDVKMGEKEAEAMPDGEDTDLPEPDPAV